MEENPSKTEITEEPQEEEMTSHYVDNYEEIRTEHTRTMILQVDEENASEPEIEEAEIEEDEWEHQEIDISLIIKIDEEKGKL